MATYRVSRVLGTRLSWDVEAASEEAALEMLDDPDKTPTEEADEDYIGILSPDEIDDESEELDSKKEEE